MIPEFVPPVKLPSVASVTSGSPEPSVKMQTGLPHLPFQKPLYCVCSSLHGPIAEGVCSGHLKNYPRPTRSKSSGGWKLFSPIICALLSALCLRMNDKMNLTNCFWHLSLPWWEDYVMPQVFSSQLIQCFVSKFSLSSLSHLYAHSFAEVRRINLFLQAIEGLAPLWSEHPLPLQAWIFTCCKLTPLQESVRLCRIRPAKDVNL